MGGHDESCWVAPIHADQFVVFDGKTHGRVFSSGNPALQKLDLSVGTEVVNFIN